MTSSSKRSENYAKQIKGATVYKVLAVVASFLTLPVMIKYLGVEMFGIWATMLSLITWIMLFDLGIGTGLKNRVLECLAQEKLQEAGCYISTAYGLIGLISILLFIIVLSASYYIPWTAIFNTDSVNEIYLRNSVILLSFFIFSNFFLSLVNQVFHAQQRSSVVVFGQLVANVLALCTIALLNKYTDSSLFLIILCYGMALIMANLALTLFLYKKNRPLFPHRSNIDSKLIYPLLSLSVNFFVIQLAGLVIFMSDKMLITQLIGPSDVTFYEVSFKLFSVIVIAQSLLLAPLWPAYADAYHRGDINWIKAKMRAQKLMFIMLCIAAVLLALVGPFVVRVWIGEEITVPKELYYYFAILTMISSWSTIYACFVNSINALSLQLKTSLIAASVNIPLSYYFVKTFGMGLNGIVLATIISVSIFAIAGPIQVHRIINGHSND